MNGHHILTLLEQVTSDQIEDLIVEAKLGNDSYRFFYTADAYDIHRFCFPGGLTGNDYEFTEDGKSINYELVTDIITGYDDLFNFISPEKPLFLAEEYSAELLGFRNKIVDLLSKAALYDYSKTFTDYLNRHFEDNTNISNDFTLFITIASGMLRSGAGRLNQLIENKSFHVKELGFANREGLEWYKNIYENAFRDKHDLYDDIYDMFVRLRGPKRGINSQLDSEAIARMIQINKKLINTTGNKNLILYFSSVDASTYIFHQIRDSLPVIEQQIFGFHRTVQQIFIQKLFKDLSVEVKIERMESIRKLSLYREVYAERFSGKKEISDKEYQQLEEKVLANVNDAWEKYINANLARPEQFKRIEDLNRQLLKIKDKPVLSNLKKLYDNLRNSSRASVSKEENLEYLEKLENAFSISHIFTITFKTAYRKLITGERIEISRGKDIITGTGQHLPIVFSFAEAPFAGIIDRIAALYLNQFAFLSNSADADDNSKVIEEIKSTAKRLYIEDFENFPIQEKFILCLYLIILPEARIEQEKTNDDHAEDFLRDMMQKDFGASPQLHADYLYVFSWILRRNRKYTDALKYVESGINLFPDDARFYHSRFLISYCQVQESNNKNAIPEYESLLEDIHKANEKYGWLLTNKPAVIRNNIVMALLNSEIYCETMIVAEKKISRDQKNISLRTIRKEKLTRLKEFAGVAYTNYPEFLHTEAFLELHESDYLSASTQKKQKIKFALNTIQHAIEKAKSLMGFKTESFEELRNDLMERMSRL